MSTAILSHASAVAMLAPREVLLASAGANGAPIWIGQQANSSGGPGVIRVLGRRAA